MQVLEHKVPPPIVVAAIGAAMWAAARLAPALEIEDSLRLAIGGAIALLGLVVTVLGVLAFRQAKTTIDPVNITAASSLVTGGVFQHTRNPMYVGFTIALVGWAMYLAVPWVLLGPIVFVLFVTRFQIVPEERVMSSKFGQEYSSYRERVRRWL